MINNRFNVVYHLLCVGFQLIKKNINMKIIKEIDFLWKGDKDMLITMWMCILLALGVLTELGFNIYFTFFN